MANSWERRIITLRPAPGVDEEGSDDGALGIEEFLVGNVARASTTSPVMPPSTKARPKMPYDAMPLASDPTSRGSGGATTLRRIPEKPTEPKPRPPKAQWMAKAENQEMKTGRKQMWIKTRALVKR